MREDFPFFDSQTGEPEVVYLDNAATTQKPRCVLEALQNFYCHINANVHRGAHRISRLATDAHEEARHCVSQFLHAASEKEVLFTSGCTEAINLVAQVLALSGRVWAGDEIVISTDAHHSNIVPWQMLCERVGAKLRAVPLAPDLSFDMAAYINMLCERTRVVAVPVVSNALGIRLPAEEITRAAKRVGALVLLDGAQVVSHEAVDVQSLGCDFFAFSGHKVYAPTGTGVLWGKEELLETLPPWKGGGEMISQVTFAHTTYNKLPFKYEAGTPDIAGDIVLAEALRYVQRVGFSIIREHEGRLMNQLVTGLREIPGVQVLGGDSVQLTSLVSIHIPGVHHYDLGTLLDQMNIAVRTGHHCCQPLMQRLGITGTTRYSVAMYNTEEDIYRALRATSRALGMLR